MYRVWKLSEAEKGKIVRQRYDGECHYYDVYESQEECDREQKRLDKIEAEYQEKMKAYLEA